MVSSWGTCMFTTITLEQVYILEHQFAKYTPSGWCVPWWLELLKYHARLNWFGDN